MKMKRKNINIILLVIFIVLIFYILFFNVGGFSREINNKLNEVILGKPDFSCVKDSDCVYKSTNCDICGGSRFINKNWNRVCLIPIYEPVNCDGFDGSKIICVNNKCTSELENKISKLFKNESK
ncbi:Uncharacterised protein [uncultured archaeon]|nr:Uncharacterised protein [uncultured archaeon]